MTYFLVLYNETFHHPSQREISAPLVGLFLHSFKIFRSTCLWKALAGVDLEDEGGVEHGEDQVEGEAHHEELPHLQPLQVQEALAQRVLQQVVVARLDEGDEHTALAP